MEPFYIRALSAINDSLAPYTFEIAIAQISTLLVIYGDGINKRLKKSLARQTIVVRFSAYIAFNAFAIGLLTISCAKVLGKFYLSLQAVYFLPIILLIFFALGFLAVNKRQI